MGTRLGCQAADRPVGPGWVVRSCHVRLRGRVGPVGMMLDASEGRRVGQGALSWWPRCRISATGRLIGSLPGTRGRRHTGAMAAWADTAFVGRLRQLERLEEGMRQVVAGQGDTVLLAGDAGIGKTRLVAELGVRARAAGALPLVGRCIDLVGAEVPYLPVVEALRPLLAREDVRELLGAVAATAPVVLVMEDLHWADRSTLDLVAFLAHNLGEQRVLLLGTYRGDELPAEHRLRRLVTGLLRAGVATRVELGPLAPQELEALLEARGGDGLSPALRSSPVRRATRCSPRSCWPPPRTAWPCHTSCGTCCSSGSRGSTTTPRACCASRRRRPGRALPAAAVGGRCARGRAAPGVARRRRSWGARLRPGGRHLQVPPRAAGRGDLRDAAAWRTRGAACPAGHRAGALAAPGDGGAGPALGGGGARAPGAGRLGRGRTRGGGRVRTGRGAPAPGAGPGAVGPGARGCRARRARSGGAAGVDGGAGQPGGQGSGGRRAGAARRRPGRRRPGAGRTVAREPRSLPDRIGKLRGRAGGVRDSGRAGPRRAGHPRARACAGGVRPCADARLAP
jgi:AAA ATPase domain